MLSLPKTMRAVRIHPEPNKTYTAEHPAPVTALCIDDIPVPTPKHPGDVLVRIKASTVIRDMLTWPEMLAVPYFTPGSDFSGVVISTHDPSGKFKAGDEVFGFGYFDPERIGAWAEYSILKESELALKPKSLDWPEAASVPLSALTAYQALFHHGELDASPLRSSASAKSSGHNNDRSILITGATGALGLWLIQMAAQAGVSNVIAATSSAKSSRSELLSLGATEVIHYDDLNIHRKDCHLVVDTAGQSILPRLWSCTAPTGIIVSVDSFTRDFVKDNRASAEPREDVKGIWFIVEPSFDDLSVISNALGDKRLRTFVDQTFDLSDVRTAYKAASNRSSRKGKVILAISKTDNSQT